MKNVLNDNISAHELEECFQKNSQKQVIDPIGSDFWAKVAQKPLCQKIQQQLHDRALREAEEPLPELTDELCAIFHETGSRWEFEKAYFERRRRLGRAAMAWILEPNNEVLRQSTMEKWSSVFGEESWAIPAHVMNPLGKDPERIDLFCAETSNMMAELLALLELGSGVSRSFTEKVRDRLHRQVHLRYVNAVASGTYDKIGWANCSHNWNAVCHHGVLGSALAMQRDCQLLTQLTLLAADHLKYFLKGFTADGGCSEGVNYWAYGFGWFCRLNELLERRTGGAYSLVEGDSLIREIARFGYRYQLNGRREINFADCSELDRVEAYLFSYLGKRFAEKQNQEWAKLQFHRLENGEVDWTDTRCDITYWIRTFAEAPKSSERITENEIRNESHLFPKLGVWVSRNCDRDKNQWVLAAKGGHNDEHHNHNDCGSFILQVNESTFFSELGVPKYEKDYFHGERYSFWTSRSKGHSLPVINGCEQKEGREYEAIILDSQFGVEKDRFELDLSKCYPQKAMIKQYRRLFEINKEKNQFYLKDQFDLKKAIEVESALITFGEVVCQGNTIFIESNDQKLKLEIGKVTEFDRIEACSFVNRELEKKDFSRIVFKPSQLTEQMILDMTLEVTSK